MWGIKKVSDLLLLNKREKRTVIFLFLNIGHTILGLKKGGAKKWVNVQIYIFDSDLVWLLQFLLI